MLRTKKGGAIAAVACGALLCAPAAASAADAVYGLTDSNRLVRFNTDAPGKVLQTVPVQGLEAGETLVGIDVRPRTTSSTASARRTASTGSTR